MSGINEQHLLQKMLDYKPESSQPVSIEMDDFTPCLMHRLSGEIYPTSVVPLQRSDVKWLGSQNGWTAFNWSRELNDSNRNVYKLLINGDERIQGAISYEIAKGFVYVHLVESAPWNIGADKKEFIGVGPHLFAIACKESFLQGFEGYVSFTSKSHLVDHYRNSLRAFHIGGLKMAIDSNEARKLVDRYFK